MRPETTTQIQGDPAFMLKPRKMRTMPGGDQRRAEEQGQPHRGEQRVVPRDEAGDDVEDAEQEPEDEPSPGLDLEGVDDLGDARR